MDDVCPCRALYRRCLVNVLEPWLRHSAYFYVRALEQLRGGLEGMYRSSLDAREPQNPTKSKEYQGYLQGVLYST
eukprot:3050430-Pyramimonas_sp.AAC.1